MPMLCIGLDPEMFFAVEREDEAKAVCADCPARKACLKQSITSHGGGSWEEHGVWGGFNPSERAVIRWKGMPAEERWAEGVGPTAALLVDHGMTPKAAAEMLGAQPRVVRDALIRLGRSMSRAELAEERHCWIAELTEMGKSRTEIVEITGLSLSTVTRARREMAAA